VDFFINFDFSRHIRHDGWITEMKNENRQTGKRRWGFVIIVIAIITGLASYYWYQDNPENFFTRDARFDFENRSMPTEKHCQTRLHWHKGAKQLYHLDIVKIDQTYPSALEGQITNKDNYALQIHMEISCTLNFRIFDKEASNDIIYIGCQLSNVNVRAGDYSDSLSRDEDLEALFRPFFLVAMHDNGLPEQFYFPPHLGLPSRKSLSEIIFAIQTVVPSNENRANLKKWRTQEQQAFGRFKVEYMLEPQSCRALIKQNIRCTALNDMDYAILKADQFQFRGIIEHSNHHITISGADASWIESYAGEETFAIFVSQNAAWYRRQTKILLTPDRQQLDPDLFIWETEMSVKDIIQSFSGNEHEEKKRDARNNKKNISERMPLSSQLEMFQKDILENASQDVILDHIQRLEQFLTKYPEETGFIPDLIKNLNIQGQAAEHVILILELIGHEEAQAAISDIFLDYNQTPDIRSKAVVAAGGIALPKPVLIDRLFQLISQEQERADIQEMNRSDDAILSLGLLNNKLYKAKNTVSANFIHNRLIGMLQNYSDDRHMIACMKALGDAKMPEGTDYLLPYIDSEDALIRRTAIQAIGKLDTHADDTDNLSDNDQDLDQEIEISASDSLTANVSAKLINHYYQENDQKIRKDIIKAVINRNESGIAHLLDDILHEETDEKIIDMIQSYLESYLQLN
jgi:HEAT repeat protein